MNNETGTVSGQGKKNAFAELMAVRGLASPGPGEVVIEGGDPFYPTPYRVAETVAAVLAGVGVAASDIWELRTGRRQSTHIDVAKAAATLRTVDYTMARNSEGCYEHVPIPNAMAHMLTVTQPWRAADGRWVLPHFNLMHLARRVLGVLGCESTPESVSAAVARWNSDALEQAIADAHACGGKVRTPEEWLEHPQGRYLAQRPVIEIEKVGDGEPQAFHPGDRPLSGVRVLDLTRILAGPVAGRTLAEHGADVLMVTAERLPQTPEHVRDTSHGKRSCFLDIRRPSDAAKLADLVRSADVFVDGYRPERLAAHGFGPEDLRRLNPNLVYVSINCFGSGGPFASRAGWEQVAQAVTGICHTHGERTGAGQPKLVFAPMCDYATGYLGALGAMLALGRRAREGGGYRVQASLCQSAMFIQRQGLVDGFAGAAGRLGAEALAPLMVASPTCYGDLKTLGPVLRMSETPPRWATPTPRLGSDEPVWLAR